MCVWRVVVLFAVVEKSSAESDELRVRVKMVSFIGRH